ncbi:MAG: TRL-like family protein [Planctomycetota bacterium]
MLNLARALLVIVLVVSLTGCFFAAPVVPPVGGLYSDIKAPMDIDFNKTAVASKSGEAMATTILGLVATGDCSINAAAKNGGITTIESADYKYFNVLGVYQTFTTIVHGN